MEYAHGNAIALSCQPREWTIILFPRARVQKDIGDFGVKYLFIEPFIGFSLYALASENGASRDWLFSLEIWRSKEEGRACPKQQNTSSGG